MKKLSKRQREWVWAVIVIVVIIGGLYWYWSVSPNLPSAIITDTNHLNNSPKADNSVRGVLAGISDASTFNSYFGAIGSEVSGKGPYTLFVPVNSAFAALPKGSVSGLSTSARKRLLEYHVVSGQALDSDAVSSGSKQTLSKDYVNFNVNLQTGVSYVGTGQVIKQYKASNGIIYTISSVLFPPK